MELLEAALKHSIHWSMRNRRHQIKVVNNMPNECLDGVEKINSKIRDESHIRAFITHFKIELNHLMGLKWIRRQRGIHSGDEESFSDRDSLDDTEDDSTQIDSSFESRPNEAFLPTIKINGKYCGVYNISGQTDDDDVSDTQLRRSYSRDNNCATEGHDDDDGYRSLSRNSASTLIIQQLNEIKLGLVDLLHEIDQSVEPRLNDEDREAYKRRRDALMLKLDQLIDSQRGSSVQSDSKAGLGPTTSSSISNNKDNKMNGNGKRHLKAFGKTLSKNNSESNLNSDDYEEQEQVINYDFKRRASDSSGMAAKLERKDSRSLLIGSARSTNKVDVCMNPRKQAIDFGAMMREYENKQKQAKDTTEVINISSTNRIVQHVPSSSSTSTYSTSSHTSSSSFL